MINESIKSMVYGALSGIGECVDGTARAFSDRCTPYVLSSFTVPSIIRDLFSQEDFDKYAAVAFCGMVLGIKNQNFSHVDKNVLIVFRGLWIEEEGDSLRLIVRCAVDDSSKPVIVVEEE